MTAIVTGNMIHQIAEIKNERNKRTAIEERILTGKNGNWEAEWNLLRKEENPDLRCSISSL